MKNTEKSESRLLCREFVLLLFVRCRRLLSHRRGSDSRLVTVIGRRLCNDFLDRRLEDLDGVGEGLAGTDLTLGIPSLHAEYGEL